jgi:2-octaprenyl-6-methoxyphenol hydroxylase
LQSLVIFVKIFNNIELRDNQDQDMEQNSNLDADLIIVGGGIAGTALACALKDSGLKIMIIEAQSLAQVASKKFAYALSLMSGAIFKGIGVWDQIFPHLGKFQHISLSDADYPQKIYFEKTDLNTPFLGYVGEHKYIIQVLQEFAQNTPDLQCLDSTKLIDIQAQRDHISVTVEKDHQQQQLKAKLVVGADGAKSKVRQWAKIKTKGWKYWQSCVAFTIQHTAPRNDIAFEKFWYNGPMGILPLPNNRCQIVWTNPHAEAKALSEMPESEFLTRLQQRIGGILGDVTLVSQRGLFPVQLMQCDRYIQYRLALVADAAHCCHPVGGQGLNLGIRDIAVLAQILQEAVAQGEDIGSIDVLKSYQNWRKKENWVILGFTDFLDRVFSTDFLPVVFIRRCGLWLMNTLPPFKLFALKLMTGLKGNRPKLAKVI